MSVAAVPWPEDVELGPGQQGKQFGQLALSAGRPSGTGDPHSVFVPTPASWEGSREERACADHGTVADPSKRQFFSSLTSSSSDPGLAYFLASVAALPSLMVPSPEGAG